MVVERATAREPGAGYLTDDVRREVRVAGRPPRRRVGDALARGFDVAASAAGLLALSPLLAALALLIRWQDGGPAFYRQERLGRFGVPFRITKFRTMVQDAESRGAKLRSTRDDPRITRPGGFLRDYHLDELPQLWDVLRGRMSLVGPRPALTFHVEYYVDWEMARLAVRPGVTGLAQTSGGNALDWDDRIVIDAWYAHHRGWKLSCHILWRTFAQLLGKGGVYRRDGLVKGWTRGLPAGYTDATMIAPTKTGTTPDPALRTEEHDAREPEHQP